MAEREGGLGHPGDVSDGRIAASRDIPTAAPCQHQTHCGPRHPSVFHNGCCQFATGMMGCDIWALDALWKRQAWPERFGDEKGHFAFVGEQAFEGVSPYPASVTQEKSPFALGSAGTQLPPRTGGEWHV